MLVYFWKREFSYLRGSWGGFISTAGTSPTQPGRRQLICRCLPPLCHFCQRRTAELLVPNLVPQGKRISHFSADCPVLRSQSSIEHTPVRSAYPTLKKSIFSEAPPPQTLQSLLKVRGGGRHLHGFVWRICDCLQLQKPTFRSIELDIVVTNVLAAASFSFGSSRIFNHVLAFLSRSIFCSINLLCNNNN